MNYSSAHLNRECQFRAKSHELIGAFSACPPRLSTTSSTFSLFLLLCAKHGLPGCRAIITRLADSLQHTINASNPCRAIRSTCTMLS